MSLHVVDPSYSVIALPGATLPEQYKALVFSRWLNSLRYGNPLFEKVDRDTFYDQYRCFIQNLLNKPDSVIRLAVLTEDHDVVLGFSVCREDVLDYVHVHKDQRKQGIAKHLIPSVITTITHLTKTAIGIFSYNEKYKLKNKDETKLDAELVRYFVFNPYI